MRINTKREDVPFRKRRHCRPKTKAFLYNIYCHFLSSLYRRRYYVKINLRHLSSDQNPLQHFSILVASLKKSLYMMSYSNPYTTAMYNPLYNPTNWRPLDDCPHHNNSSQLRGLRVTTLLVDFQDIALKWMFLDRWDVFRGLGAKNSWICFAMKGQYGAGQPHKTEVTLVLGTYSCDYGCFCPASSKPS